MDILNFLKNLIGDGNIEALSPIINLLRENSFDIKKALNNITPETLAAISGALFKQNASNAQNNYADTTVRTHNAVSPIANIADKDIVYTLNRYISTEYQS